MKINTIKFVILFHWVILKLKPQTEHYFKLYSKYFPHKFNYKDNLLNLIYLMVQIILFLLAPKGKWSLAEGKWLRTTDINPHIQKIPTEISCHRRNCADIFCNFLSCYLCIVWTKSYSIIIHQKPTEFYFSINQSFAFTSLYGRDLNIHISIF